MAAAVANKPKHDWADDDDIEETSTDLPPPQTISNKDGTKTVITFRYNDDGEKVKTTRRIRFITHTETVNPRVADRKTWSKFGLSAKDPPGPAPDTTSVGENIIFRPSINWRKDAKDETADPNAQAMKDKLKDKKVKCRICNGEHFTARCPYKDTMAPIGESGAADVAAGMGDEPAAAAAGGAGAKKGSYVPPALRGTGGAGERMGSKFGERDDFATLRVTNVSEMAEEGELRDMFERFGRVTRVFLAKDRGNRHGQGIRLYQLRRPRRRCQGLRKDGRIWFQASHSPGGVCQEGSVGILNSCRHGLVRGHGNALVEGFNLMIRRLGTVLR
ncbi:translation initiation factor eIF3 subunit g [Fusarium falciforme]|nr:translation initiation factor eIF3 subunit g [Fusarium falciforme]